MFRLKSQLMLMLLTLTLTIPSWAKSADVVTAENRVISVTSNIVRLLETNRERYSQDTAALNAMVRREVLPIYRF